MSARDRAWQMLSTALKMEEKGRQYYQQAAADSHDEMARRIFQTLADEEEAHLEHLRRIWAEVEGGAFEADGAARLRNEIEEGLLQNTTEDLRSFFAQVTRQHTATFRPDTDDLGALDLAIEFEGKAVDFYQSQLDSAEHGLERRFLTLMLAEERGHLEALEDLKRFLTDANPWDAGLPETAD